MPRPVGDPPSPFPPAHRNKRQRRCAAHVRPGRHGRLGGTARTTTGDSRRGAATAATGLYKVSTVLFLLGEAAEGCCRCCRAAVPAPVCRRIERERGKEQPGGEPQQARTKPTGATNPRTTQRRAGARRCDVLLAAPEEAEEPAATCESARRN